ncbi:hypothetical protein GA0074695_6471 [Micromonospora viridifaciens]|uniref:Uncharacterized protein n=1 Tax=Micromonospora viridifaciens TaxID=1881 RepID=A0A1C5A1D3_MICVI|nr:hypothetical protein [Micromonospora viridifaciens]SCF38993.1 hypothetical protein GA0074695_6471 [Micromonospora viridifaciens]
MKLPPGATGFNPPPGNQADLRTFTAACHHAARAIDATVTGVTPAGVTPNFHAVDIADAQHHIAVLRHTTLPFIAFARPHADGDVMVTFVDHPDLAAALINLTHAQALTVDQLQTPLTQVDLSALDRADHDQIGYWKPTTVGELLFNFWD